MFKCCFLFFLWFTLSLEKKATQLLIIAAHKYLKKKETVRN